MTALTSLRNMGQKTWFGTRGLSAIDSEGARPTIVLAAPSHDLARTGNLNAHAAVTHRQQSGIQRIRSLLS